MSTESKLKKEYHLPGDFVEAIKTRPVSEIEEIFDELERVKLLEIPGCTSTEQLLQVQAGAKQVLVLKQFFLAEMQRK